MPDNNFTGNDISQLFGPLAELISLAEAGEWDAVVALAPNLSQQLASLDRTGKTALLSGQKYPIDREYLAKAIALLEKAGTLCAERREQIAPLVNSLKPLPNSLSA